MKLGLLLPNQGVVFGATTVPELLDLAGIAEGSGLFESLWVGDNLLAKPRLERVTLLSGLATATKTSGSIATGKRIYAAVASDMKRVTLECGGNDAVRVV